MFVLKALRDVFGMAEGNTDLVQIPSGQLFLVQPSNTKTPFECIFNDAAATIRRTSTPYNYQLVISKVYAEGENIESNGDGLDDVDGDDERAFLIDEALSFRVVKDDAKRQVRLVWEDLSGYPSSSSLKKSYHFIVDLKATNQYSIDAFEGMMYNCMYERKYQKSYNDATEEELAVFAYDPSKAGQTPSKASIRSTSASPDQQPSTPSARKSKSTSTTAKGTPMSLSTTAKNTPSKTAPMSLVNSPAGSKPTTTTPAITPAHTAPVGETLVQVPGALYVYDIRIYQFVVVSQSVTISLRKTAPFKFWLTVSDSNSTTNQYYISQPVEQKMNAVFNNEHLSFVWNLFQKSNDEEMESVRSFSIKFPDLQSANAFRDMFGSCMYETNNEEEWKKAKKDDQEYVLNAFTEDVEMRDVFDDVREASSDDEEEEERREQEEEEEEEETTTRNLRFGGTPSKPSTDFGIAENSTSFATPSKNSQLAVGYKHDRSFVVRGDRLGVFKYDDDSNRLVFDTAINNIRDMENKNFSPRKVMLHEEDRSMIMMKPNEDHKLYKMDLEYGKVVEEWNIDENIPVTQILPDSKYAQMTPQKTLVGISSKAIFRIDPRLSGKKLVDSESKQYVSKNQFSCATTTGKGELAVASEKGDIRLFNKLNVRAKTHLPGIGDPIIGIDVTEDGKWIIATCKNYLLLINTTPKEGTSGFHKSMGEQKPIPRRLQLKPEHVAWMGIPVNFTAARFNTGQDTEERTIVTSSGPYVITWNFRRVKQGHLNDYQIKKYSDNIVADNFRFGQDKNIIVALPNDVAMVSKSQLQTPSKLLKSRSDIVNSPF